MMIPSADRAGDDGMARVDMHCHSTASAEARLGVQRSLGLPECATPPAEVYDLAKRRGMDFVTITDHDTIDGCLEIADRRDVFISEELTAWFVGEPQAVHILCYGITPEHHELLHSLAGDLEECAAYLHEHEIACALAHPFFAVAAPLGPRHRSRLAELFPVWETRNGSRARELNMPATVYIETRGGTGIGGSDDHAGVDIGRTWTKTPPASTPEELLAHIRGGRTEAQGEQGSAAKWAHSALALGARALLRDAPPRQDATTLSPGDVLELAERVVSDGAQRGGEPRLNLRPEQARELLRAWRESLSLDDHDPSALIRLMQENGFSHAELYRRARRRHERALREAVERFTLVGQSAEDYTKVTRALFDACIPVAPYMPSTMLLGGEKARLAGREEGPGRVALVVDGAGRMHGVTHTIERIREHGVPGWDVDVIGTDPRVDRRLPAVAETEIPFYAGFEVGVPSLTGLIETLVDGSYDLVHVTAPGPAGVAAALAANIGGVPMAGSYHTELAAYAGIRTGDHRLEAIVGAGLSLFYGRCEVVLSPSRSADHSLLGLGVAPERLARWGRGVDSSLYDPARRNASAYPGEVNVLYAGRLAEEKGVDLLAEAFLRARERDPRLHLLLAGGGPEEATLRDRLGPNASFLGWLDREQLATAYASADIFLFCSRTDTYGQVIAEAQASGLPVVAIAEGGPLSLISHRHTGWLCPADVDSLAGAVSQLARSPFLRERIARAALLEARARTWDIAFEQLGAGYSKALAQGGPRAAAPPRRLAA